MRATQLLSLHTILMVSVLQSLPIAVKTPTGIVDMKLLIPSFHTSVPEKKFEERNGGLQCGPLHPALVSALYWDWLL